MVWEYYDGPRSGIADFGGEPHYFESGWCDVGDVGDDVDDVFALAPVDAETLALAREQWTIWRAWELAFHSGLVTQETHPGHGGRDARYDELEALLEHRIAVPMNPQVVATASFEADAQGPDLPRGMMRELLVTWGDANRPWRPARADLEETGR